MEQGRLLCVRGGGRCGQIRYGMKRTIQPLSFGLLTSRDGSSTMFLFIWYRLARMQPYRMCSVPSAQTTSPSTEYLRGGRGARDRSGAARSDSSGTGTAPRPVVGATLRAGRAGRAGSKGRKHRLSNPPPNNPPKNVTMTTSASGRAVGVLDHEYGFKK